MKCPTCDTELARVPYEGLYVLRCEGCFGYLVASRRVEGIKRARRKSIHELMEETTAEGQADSEHPLRCPRCRRKMEKRFLADPALFHLDTCHRCELVWFDGGELARLQLSHEISPRGKDAAELQRRWREMPPERREEFEQNLARLPVDDTAPFSVFEETLAGALLHRWR